MNKLKRLEALEQGYGSPRLLFPNFLLEGLPEHLEAFHNSGQMGQCCTLDEAGRAVFTNTIYELIQRKYREHESINQ